MKAFRVVASAMLMAIVVACNKTDDITEDRLKEIEEEQETTSSSSSDSDGNKNVGEEVVAPSDGDNIANQSFTKVVKITWSGASAVVENLPDNVFVTDNASGKVVLTSNADSDVCYELSGEGTGSLKLYSDKLYKVSLNGVKLTSSDGPALNLQSHKRAFIYTEGGTTNTLSDASTYVSSEEDQKGAIFAEGQLVFCGNGVLNIAGNYKHAICSDDYVIGMGGTVNVTKAASDAVHTNSYIIITDGSWTTKSVGEGLQAEEGNVCITGGKVDVSTTGDKGHGISTAGNFRQTGGTLVASASGAGSKCIKSDGQVNISGGTFMLTTSGGVYKESSSEVSTAACINCDGNLNISGGTFSMKSSGQAGKGINVDGTSVYGTEDGSGPEMTIVTTGSAYGTSNSSQFGWGGNTSSSSSNSKAIKSDGLLTINGGKFNITTSSDGAEGIESKTNLTINGGEIYVQAYDDAINASGVITMNGGYVYAYATNNDAIDSNYGKSGAIVVNGGVMIAHGASSPEEGLDADSNSYLKFNGGAVFTSGGQQMNSSSPTCTVPVVYLAGSSMSKGYFTVTDANGNVVMSVYVPRAMSQNYSFVSSSGIKSGSTYKYGILSTAPSNYTSSWGTYYYEGGTVSSTLGSSFTASSGYSTTGSTSSSSGGIPGRW